MIISQVTGPDVLNLTQFGVAGLMGALWWWERRYSRQREEELTQAHQVILETREHLSAVLDALQGNTKVIAEFTAVVRTELTAINERLAESQGSTADR